MMNVAKKPMKLLLHVCCAPCSLEPVRLLRDAALQPTLFYANSNIHPYHEYSHRLETLQKWANEERLPVIEGNYDTDTWEATAGCIGDACAKNSCSAEALSRDARCRACYRLRFEETARYAAEHGFSAIGTTLSVSPYQYSDIIKEELEKAAAKAGIEALFEDYRPCYERACQKSRELGLYRQNYCGCRFSFHEAQHQREMRKQERSLKKQLKAEERAQAEEKRQEKRAARQLYDEKQQHKRAILKQLRNERKKETPLP